MNADQRRDLLDMVTEAQEKMYEAIDLLQTYCRQSRDRHTEAYILDHLKIMTSADHGFLSREANLGEVIDGLLHPEEPDDDEEDCDDDDEAASEAQYRRHYGDDRA